MTMDFTDGELRVRRTGAAVTPRPAGRRRQGRRQDVLGRSSPTITKTIYVETRKIERGSRNCSPEEIRTPNLLIVGSRRRGLVRCRATSEGAVRTGRGSCGHSRCCTSVVYVDHAGRLRPKMLPYAFTGKATCLRTSMRRA